MRKTKFIPTIVLLILLVAGVALAASQYNMRESVVSGGGGEHSSAGYILIDVVGEAVVGNSTSSNFILRSGFLPMSASTPTPTPVQTLTPIPAPTPMNISGDINGNGTVQQTIVYSIFNGQTVLTIGQGTTALTATGTPLQSLNAAEVSLNIPPAPAGAYVIGRAYDYSPHGAVFTPPITMTLQYDPSMLLPGVDANNLVVAYYDSAVSEWVVLPSTVDMVNHIVTAQVRHLTLFAVYAPAPPMTTTPALTVAPTPTPTPTAGNKTNIGIIIAPIIALIVIGLVVYWFLRRRSKPTTGPTEGPEGEGKV